MRSRSLRGSQLVEYRAVRTTITVAAVRQVLQFIAYRLQLLDVAVQLGNV